MSTTRNHVYRATLSADAIASILYVSLISPDQFSAPPLVMCLILLVSFIVKAGYKHKTKQAFISWTNILFSLLTLILATIYLFVQEWNWLIVWITGFIGVNAIMSGLDLTEKNETDCEKGMDE